MNHWASAWVVAKWEFARYFKLKSEIISILLWIAISGMLWGWPGIDQPLSGIRHTPTDPH